MDDDTDPGFDSGANEFAVRVPGFEIYEALFGGLPPTYRARQLSLNRIVALSTITLESWQPIYRRDTDVLARLQHPHVLSLIDRFEHQGLLCIVTEYISGGSVQDRTHGQAQPVRCAVSLVEHVARTLAYVHGCGITHCNLKPANILLAAPPATPTGPADQWLCEDVFGIPVLCDFALAMDEQRRAEVEEGWIFGTPSYMAPEQAWGRLGEIGPASDIYSLGVILFELLTGRRPFEFNGVHNMIEQLKEKTAAPIRSVNPNLDGGLAAICDKCLHQEPGKRFTNALELAFELRGALDGRSSKRWLFW